jgi:hypothetical protein
MLKESELDAQFGLVEDLLKDQRKQNQLSENIRALVCQKQQDRLLMKFNKELIEIKKR